MLQNRSENDPVSDGHRLAAWTDRPVDSHGVWSHSGNLAFPGERTVNRESDEAIRVELVDWSRAERLIRPIRATVFIHEQDVPEELEWDGLDPQCTHALAWNGAGEAIGTARMQSAGTIGRMAVLKTWRGRGAGRALLDALLDVAYRQGLSRVTLSAQTHAIGFYERAGFRAVGELFMDAGIPHRKMEKTLTQANDVTRRDQEPESNQSPGA
jgi:predicted GNAT family N-acyltransferase